jgi:hypothetical protein
LKDEFEKAIVDAIGFSHPPLMNRGERKRKREEGAGGADFTRNRRRRTPVSVAGQVKS